MRASLPLAMVLATAITSLASERAAAAGPPRTISVKTARARLEANLRSEQTSRGIRAMIRKALPRRGRAELVATGSYGHASYELRRGRDRLTVASNDYHAQAYAFGERDGIGRQWTRRFVHSGLGTMAASFRPDGRLAVIKNEERTLQYQDRYIPLTHFAETAEIRVLGPGRFDVRYDVIVTDPDENRRPRARYEPGRYRQRMTIELTHPRTLVELWNGNVNRGLELRQAIFEMARVNLFEHQQNAHVRDAFGTGHLLNQAWATRADE